MQVLFTSFKLVWDGQWWGRGWGTRGVGGAVVGVEKNGNGSWTMVSENDAPSSPPTRSIVPTHRRDVFKSFKMAWGWTSVGGGEDGDEGCGWCGCGSGKNGNGSWTTVGENDAPSSPLTHNRPHTPTRRLQIVQNCVGVDVGGGARVGTRGVGGAVVGAERTGRRSDDDGWGRRPTLHPHTPSFSHTDETSSNRSTWCGGGRWWGGGRGWGRWVWVVRWWERKEGDGGRTTMGENDDAHPPPRRWRNDDGETIQLYLG